MPLQTVPSAPRRSSQFSRTDGVNLATAVKQLQGLKQKIVTGAGANTNIAVSGIATSDVIVSVLNLTDLDTPGGVTIFSAGNIRSTSDTTGDKLLVTYFDVA